MVSTAHPICAASTCAPCGVHFSEDPSSYALSLMTFFSAVKFFSFLAIHPANSFMEDFSTSCSMPYGGLHRVVVVVVSAPHKSPRCGV